MLSPHENCNLLISFLLRGKCCDFAIFFIFFAVILYFLLIQKILEQKRSFWSIFVTFSRYSRSSEFIRTLNKVLDPPQGTTPSHPTTKIFSENPLKSLSSTKFQSQEKIVFSPIFYHIFYRPTSSTCLKFLTKYFLSTTIILK